MTPQPLLLALAALAVGVTLPATAQSTHSMVVHSADLDLAKPSDVRHLDARIRHAANELCGRASDSDLSARNAMLRCRKDAARTGADRRQAAISRASAGRVAAR